jgi:hypothetical protein
VTESDPATTAFEHRTRALTLRSGTGNLPFQQTGAEAPDLVGASFRTSRRALGLIHPPDPAVARGLV